MTRNKMVQYGVWPNCCNECKFCLREERKPISLARQFKTLEAIKHNISTIDWSTEFTSGVSLLGGELYFIKDAALQDAFMSLVDTVIERVLKVSPNPQCKFSTVTNGLYDPAFLYRVVDCVVSEAGISKLDLNVSFDMKYRFKSDADKELVLRNINDFHKRYDYDIGVQMILTQYLIDMWKNGEFDVKVFEDTYIPGNTLTLLYPHPIHTSIVLDDFFFKRTDFLAFMKYLKAQHPMTFRRFAHSTANSCTFKYTGVRNKASLDPNAKPILADGKEVLNTNCGHSMLYTCYSDSDRCMLCDLKAFDAEIFL